MASLPVGKLPPQLLASLLARAPISDPRVAIGPGPGMDCAVLDFGDRYLVLKSDPITFATNEIGWYLVQVNANDLATTGATPRWMLVTALLPEAGSPPELVEAISLQVYDACARLGISVVGGHTEITSRLDRPILCGTLIGEVEKDRLVTPKGARPGDRLLLTKGVPIEATSLLAREFHDKLQDKLPEEVLEKARNFLYDPGISVVRDAAAAVRSGQVHAMHDPTEGGLAGALWELSDASGCGVVFEPRSVPIPGTAAQVCAAMGVDPLAAIASGALLLAVPAEGSAETVRELEAEGIDCAEIGWVDSGQPGVWVEGETGKVLYPRPVRDEVARIFEISANDH